MSKALGCWPVIYLQDDLTGESFSNKFDVCFNNVSHHMHKNKPVIIDQVNRDLVACHDGPVTDHIITIALCKTIQEL